MNRPLAVLPDLSESTREALKATGTDDVRARENRMALFGAIQTIHRDFGGLRWTNSVKGVSPDDWHETLQNKRKTLQ